MSEDFKEVRQHKGFREYNSLAEYKLSADYKYKHKLSFLAKPHKKAKSERYALMCGELYKLEVEVLKVSLDNYYKLDTPSAQALAYYAEKLPAYLEACKEAARIEEDARIEEAEKEKRINMITIDVPVEIVVNDSSSIDSWGRRENYIRFYREGLKDVLKELLIDIENGE